MSFRTRALGVFILVASLGLMSPRARADDSPTITEVEDGLRDASPQRAAFLTARVWTSPLGLLLEDYLFGEAPPERVSQRARQIASRVLSSVRLRLARLSALEIMLDDLFARGLVTERVQIRKAQLDLKIEMKIHRARERATRKILKLWPLYLTVGLAGGSKIVREQAGAAVEAAAIAIGIERRAAPVHALHAFKSGFLRRLGEDFFVEYSALKAGSTAVGTAGLVAGPNWFFQGSADEGSDLKEQAVNYLLQAQSKLEDL